MVERHACPDGQLHPLRAGDVTASNVGSLIGVNPFKSRLAYWAELRGILTADADTKLTRRGKLFEPVVVAATREARPDWDIRYPLGLYFRDAELNLGATPDALAWTGPETGLLNLQCKVVSKSAFERHWAEGPPPSYELQVICENMLMDVDGGMLAALVIEPFGYELGLFPIPRHAGREAQLRDIVAAFWGDVRTGNRPPADPPSDGPTVAAMFPRSSPEPVLDLTGDNRLAALLPERALHKAQISSLSERVEAIDTEIKDKLAEHERAQLPGWNVSWKTHERKEFTVPAGSYRKLTVTQVKDEASAAA